MLSDKELADWYNGKVIDGLTFSVDSAAEVIEGEHKGDLVTLISLESTSPVVAYLVENKDGESYVINQSKLQAHT